MIPTSFEEPKPSGEQRESPTSQKNEEENGISTEFSLSNYQPPYLESDQASFSFPTTLPQEDLSSSTFDVQEVSPSTSPTSEDMSHTLDHPGDVLIREKPIEYTEPDASSTVPAERSSTAKFDSVTEVPAQSSPQSEVTIEIQVPSSRSSSTSQDTVHESTEPIHPTVSTEQQVSSSSMEKDLSSPVTLTSSETPQATSTSSITEETLNATSTPTTPTPGEEQWTSSPQVRKLSTVPAENSTTSTALVTDEVSSSSAPDSSVTASTVHDDSGANTSLAAAIDQETSLSDLQSPEPRKLPSITAVEATPEASSFSSPSSTSHQISSTSPKSSRTSSISLGKGTEVEASASSPVTITTSSDPQKTTVLSAAEAPSTASSTSFASLENQENLTSTIDDLSSDSPTTRTSAEHVDSTVRDTTEQISGSELTHRDHDPSTHSHENLIVEELEISVDTKPTQSRPSSPYDLASPISDDRERTVSESDIHLSSTNDDPPTVRIDDAFSLSNKEEGEGEPNQSSSHSPIEETRPTDILSSIVVKEYPSFDSPTEPQPSPVPDSSQQSSHDSSLTDVEGQSQRPQSPTETI